MHYALLTRNIVIRDRITAPIYSEDGYTGGFAMGRKSHNIQVNIHV